MSSPDSINDIMITCAACGKEGDGDNMNTCNKCKAVKYCNAACKKKHRKTHKKKCEIRAAELHEEALFKEHPPEECPVCFLPLPLDPEYTTFKSCCGKLICNGCIYAIGLVAIKKGKREEAGNCPFCRGAEVDNVTSVKRVKKLVENGNAYAMKMLASHYRDGSYGLPRDFVKANELNLKAGELGCTSAYLNLGEAYRQGLGVGRDPKKAKHYIELAAMNGNVLARHNLGALEGQAGNEHRAYKHMIIAAKAGDKESLQYVQRGFKGGIVTKDEYENTLRAYQQRSDEMKNDMRDQAQVFRNRRRGGVGVGIGQRRERR